ncbi:HAAS signaling domain-containing protein [Actinomadura alba]|uniref:DUF1700 domain-containing protein n=1 Tax=Actinomadura alba TaxID=406431 RepID=A0ABR7LT87_9ACTN|nr:hypothetical protein [Actinomadura alba]MBC6468064.1 hypothetical protein [Actinomadura alba]
MTVTDPLIDEYLDRLETATRTLPSARRAELLAEIKEHIEVTLSQSQDEGEATVRSVLDRLGNPEDIAREAGAGLQATAPAGGPAAWRADGQTGGRRGVAAFELATVILLLVGGIVLPVLGWVIGAVLLWASARWTLRDKVIGTLVFPGGLAVPAWYLLFASGSSTCSPDGTCETSGMPFGLTTTLTLIATAGSIASAGYLLHRAGSTAT